jgi:hypothetical protein
MAVSRSEMTVYEQIPATAHRPVQKIPFYLLNMLKFRMGVFKHARATMASFGYGRVSTREQTTENQRLELEAAGYAVKYWYADEGVSRKVSVLQRPPGCQDAQPDPRW